MQRPATIAAMRWSPFTALALAGCNAIFGLDDEAKLVDGPPPVDAPTIFETVDLQYQLATTELVGANIVASPVQDLALAQIDPPPAVRIATFDGAFIDTEYTDGSVELTLPDLRTQRWRLEYAIPGEPPREVQWQPDIDRARITVPRHGRLPRTAPPDGSGYIIVPKNGNATSPGPGAFTKARVFVTGTFIDVFVDAAPADTRLAPFQNQAADPMTISGPPGSPEAVPGDFAVLVNYKSTASCERLVDGFAEFRPPTLTSNLESPLDAALAQDQPPWSRGGAESVQITYTNANGLETIARLSESLGGAATPDGGRDFGLGGAAVQYGYTPHLELPTYVGEPTLQARFGVGVVQTAPVPAPMLFALAQCDYGQATISGFEVPPTSLDFPRLVYAAMFDHRTTSGVQLVSSIVSVGAVNAGTAVIDFAVPFTLGPVTLDDGTAMHDLAAPLTVPEQPLSVPPGTGAFELRFKLEGGNLPNVVDYFEVALYKIANGKLALVRTYVSAETAVDADRVIVQPIRIDRALLDAGAEYVLALRTVRGRPNADIGDYEQVTFPHAMTTTFTRTFKIEQ